MSASRHDVLVVGGGHNGLTAAGLLTKAGRKVLVLERRRMLGGLAAPEEFHPGYRSGGVLQDTTGVRRGIVRALGLERHGLRMRRTRPDVLALGDGAGLLLAGDPDRAAREIGALSSSDAGAYLRYRAFLAGIRPAVEPFVDGPPIDLVGADSAAAWELAKRALRVRRLGRRDMLELLRLPPMCVADWLDEWFQSELLKAALALPAVAGTFLGPRSPGSNANLLLQECAAGPGVEGDGPALTDALERAARALGVELRTGATVERILLGSGSVRGVRLEGGEEIQARVVASSCDPKRTLLKLLPRGSVKTHLQRHIRAFRTRGTTAQVLLALAAPPRFVGGDRGSVPFVRTGGHMAAIERAFEAVKYRRFSADPVLEIHVPTAECPDRAPHGHAVVSVLVHFAPRDLEPPWDEGQRQRLGDRVVTVLERHAPGISSSVVKRVVLSPADLEERYAITGGHIHHGEHLLDQLLVRPSPECAAYATPVPGLFLCGSGSHPGGGLTCAPGALAADAILERS